MKIVRLVGYRPGLNTVALIRALHDLASLSLRDSTKVVEDLISDEKPTIEFRTLAAANQFAAIADELGVGMEL